MLPSPTTTLYDFGQLYVVHFPAFKALHEILYEPHRFVIEGPNTDH